MIGSRELPEAVFDANLDTHISFVGSHISALPKEVLELECVDSVLLNEGVYSLWNLLRSNLSDEELKKVKGYWLESNSKTLIVMILKNSTSRKNGYRFTWICSLF